MTTISYSALTRLAGARALRVAGIYQPSGWVETDQDLDYITTLDPTDWVRIEVVFPSGRVAQVDYAVAEIIN